MIVILNVLRLSQFSMYKYLYSETRFKCFSFLLGNFVGVLQPKNEVLKTKSKVIPSYSRLPIIQTFKGNRKKFELSRVKLYRECSEGHENCFELAGGSSYRESTVFPNQRFLIWEKV